MGNGKRQEVAIGDLAVAEHSLPMDEALLQQAGKQFFDSKHQRISA